MTIRHSSASVPSLPLNTRDSDHEGNSFQPSIAWLPITMRRPAPSRLLRLKANGVCAPSFPSPLFTASGGRSSSSASPVSRTSSRRVCLPLRAGGSNREGHIFFENRRVMCYIITLRGCGLALPDVSRRRGANTSRLHLMHTSNLICPQH